MSLPQAWVKAPYALLHGEDGEGRLGALEAWKREHVDPEWADFSLTVCADGCPWAEVHNALSESAPLGAERVVVVPQADNLLERPKELPAAVKAMLVSPLPGTRLLLVCRNALSAAPGRILASKPFTDWAKEGRVLKVGALDAREAAACVEEEARALGLRLGPGLAASLAARLGGNPGILRRHLEVLDLMAEDRKVTEALVDLATFRLGEQGDYAWSQAWQKGNLNLALLTLRQALEDKPGEAPLKLLFQARREVDRLCRLVEARGRGLRQPAELLEALGLNGRQAFLLDQAQRVLDRIKPGGARRLMKLVNQTDLDLKGCALSGSPTPLMTLTVELCRAWAGSGR